MLARYTNEELDAETNQMRTDAVKTMMDSPQRFNQQILESMDLAIQGMARDQTSVMLREGLASAFLKDAEGRPRALDDNDVEGMMELRECLEKVSWLSLCDMLL